MIIHHDTSQKKVKENATQQLNTLLVEHSAMPVLLLLSGGSALQLIDEIDLMSLSKTTMISVLDERIGSDENSNFYQLMQTVFYREAQKQGVQFFDVRAKEGENEKDAALRLQKMFRMLLKMMPTTTIIATVGVGPDGHTAGVMPYPDELDFFTETFDTKNDWIVGYDAGTKNSYPKRVTVSLSFLRDHIDYAIAYATGENKKESLQKLIAEEGSLAQTPARILREMKNVHLYTDVDGLV